MKVAARPFRNARDAVPYCHQLGVDTAIMECTQIPGWEDGGHLEPDAFKERVHMVHIRDVNGDWKSVKDMRSDAYDLEVFPGTGIAQNEQVVRRLHQIGYQGVVQPEHLGRPGEAELLPAAMQYLQDLTGAEL